MKSTVWFYIGAGVLFILSICGIGWGGLMMLGSTAPNGQPGWFGTGLVLLTAGVVMVGAALFIIYLAAVRNLADAPQNTTFKIDLPGDVKMEQMKCRSCGGVLKAENVQLVNGAPMVTCPYCNTVYQLSEEPKW